MDGPQDAGDAFETPEALMAGVGLYDLTQRTLRDELQAGRLHSL